MSSSEKRSTSGSEHYLDVVFDGPPGPEAGRFVEVESPEGSSVKVGQWIERADGFWALRLGAEDLRWVAEQHNLQLVHAAQAAYQALLTGEYLNDAEAALKLALENFRESNADVRAPAAATGPKSDRQLRALTRAELLQARAAALLGDAARDLLAAYVNPTADTTLQRAALGSAYAAYELAGVDVIAACVWTGDLRDIQRAKAAIAEAADLADFLDAEELTGHLKAAAESLAELEQAEIKANEAEAAGSGS